MKPSTVQVLTVKLACATRKTVVVEAMLILTTGVAMICPTPAIAVAEI